MCICKSIISLVVIYGVQAKGSIIFAMVFLLIAYGMSGQPLELHRFVLFCVMGICVALCSEGLGLIVGAAFSATNGAIIGPATAAPLLALSCYGMGFGQYIEASMQALMSASYLRFGVTGLCLSLYTERAYLSCPVQLCLYSDPQLLLRDIGMAHDVYYMQIIAIIFFTILHRTVAYVALRYQLTADRSNKLLSKISNFLKHSV